MEYICFLEINDHNDNDDIIVHLRYNRYNINHHISHNDFDDNGNANDNMVILVMTKMMTTMMIAVMIWKRAIANNKLQGYIITMMIFIYSLQNYENIWTE